MKGRLTSFGSCLIFLRGLLESISCLQRWWVMVITYFLKYRNWDTSIITRWRGKGWCLYLPEWNRRRPRSLRPLRSRPTRRRRRRSRLSAPAPPAAAPESAAAAAASSATTTLRAPLPPVRRPLRPNFLKWQTAIRYGGANFVLWWSRFTLFKSR